MAEGGVAFRHVVPPQPPRVVVIGDSGVGKTTLSAALAGKPVRSPFATIGLDFYRIDIVSGTHEEDVTKLHLWDCSGQDQFFPLIPSSKQHEDSTFICVYDVTNVASFLRVPHWVDIVRNRTGLKSLIIIGNKTDLFSKRMVTMREGMELSRSLQADFLEMSALEDPNVRDMLVKVLSERCRKNVSSSDRAEAERLRRTTDERWWWCC